MNEPEVQPPAPLPRCPYCSTDLEMPALFNWSFSSGPLTQLVLCVYCSNLECRKILGTQVVMAANAGEEPRISRPH